MKGGGRVEISALFSEIPRRIARLFEAVEYPWDLLSRLDALLDFADVSGMDEIREGIFVGKGVSISPLATLIAPLVISDGCEIRPGAYLRGKCFLGEGVTVGNSSEVKRSVLLPHAQLPHYNYVGDSVIGRRAHFGAGAVASNLKSDGSSVTVHAEAEYETGLRKLGAAVGDGAEIGCGAVLSPGAVIGRYATVYPQVFFRGTLAEGMIFKSDGSCVARKARN